MVTDIPASEMDDATVDPLSLYRCSASAERRAEWTALDARPRWANDEIEIATVRDGEAYVDLAPAAAQLRFLRYLPGTWSHRLVALAAPFEDAQVSMLVGLDELALDALIFEELVNRRFEEVTRIAARRGVRDAEQTAVDAFAKIWFYGIRAKTPDRTWLPAHSIMKGTLKGLVSNEKAAPKMGDDGTTIDRPVGAEDPADARHDVAVIDGRIDAGDFLASLAPADRQMLYLRGEEELSYEQIGAKLGIGYKTAERRCKATIQRVGALWREYTDDKHTTDSMRDGPEGNAAAERSAERIRDKEREA